MPLFEYQCQDCSRRFEAFVTRERAPECPSCRGTQLRKLLSAPGMVGTGAARETEPFPSSCGAGCGCRPGADECMN
jgi:putative FmdB family regulatory protein